MCHDSGTAAQNEDTAPYEVFIKHGNQLISTGIHLKTTIQHHRAQHTITEINPDSLGQKLGLKTG